MRIIFFLLLVAFTTKPLLSQVSNKKVMQGEMLETINKTKKEIVELEKKIGEAKINKVEPATIKTMEDQLVMMKANR